MSILLKVCVKQNIGHVTKFHLMSSIRIMISFEAQHQEQQPQPWAGVPHWPSRIDAIDARINKREIKDKTGIEALILF